MEDQFVSYKLAKQLKELGFDKNCLGWWQLVGNNIPKLNLEHSSSDWMQSDWTKTFLSPLYQQVLKWLREEKHIILEVRPIDSWDSWTYQLWGKDDMAPFFQIYPHSDEDPFEGKTYEEALEEGLKAALKFITP